MIATYAKVGIKNLLVLVASSSYMIYLFHTTFEGFAKAVFRKMPIDSDVWYIFLFEAFVVILIGVVAPIVLHLVVLKRWQLTRLLFGLGK